VKYVMFELMLTILAPCTPIAFPQVVQERQHAIDAAIVRVMKMRKTLAHKLLVQEVMTQLRFQLTNADLKRRIDNLIEREFLERSSSDSQVYNYLA
jgi:hypothetical protein